MSPAFFLLRIRTHPSDIYRQLIKLRKEFAQFRNDRVIWLHNSNEADLVSFMRLDGMNEFVIVVNLSSRPLIGWVEVRNDHQFKLIKFPGMPEAATYGFPMFRLNGYEWRIYHRIVSPM